MRQVRYQVAASLDGYIADPEGGYDWIPNDPDIDFDELMGRFDAYVMGRKTWETVRGVGGAPGKGEVWVVSRTLRPEDARGATVVGESELPDRLRELRSRPGKEIWLFGGGELFRTMLAMDEVDVVEVAVLPVLLGGGIPLLASPGPRRRLELRSHRVYPKSGIVLLEYAVKRSDQPAEKPMTA